MDSTYDEFAADPRRRKLLVEEDLTLEATEKICEYMGRESMTRTELAKRLGLTKSYITQILSGSKNVTLRVLANAADVLGYEVKLRFEPCKQKEFQIE